MTNVLAKHILADGFEQVIDLNRSHGSWLVDGRDGREYLDLFSMFATMPVGYNHPRLLEQKDRLLGAALNKPTNSDFYTTEMAEFVDTFFSVAMPPSFLHAFFIEGGAMGVENALKAAFDWKVRKNFSRNGTKEEVGSQVIHFEQCFHGRSGYTLSLTNTADPRKTAYFPKFNWPRVRNPKITFPLTPGNVTAVQAAEEQSLSQIGDAIRKNGPDIAGLIIEPIQGEGGDNHFRPEFLRALRDICDQSEILLIFDEVQCGMGITGRMWAWEHSGVTPDLMTFGKKSQVCGFASTARIDEVERNVFREPTRLNSTWGGSLVDMVRLTIYLEIMRDEKLVEHAARAGKHLLMKLEELQNEFPDRVASARGKGLMCAFDLPTSETRDALLKQILQNGVILLASGTHSVRFRPALTITESEINFGIDQVRASLRQVPV